MKDEEFENKETKTWIGIHITDAVSISSILGEDSVLLCKVNPRDLV